jgi:predicted ATP-binding protein involved in virulence
MKKSRIKKFAIYDLFGYQDVDISFENKTKILIGENGIGKTTVLNCLYYLISKKFDKLDKIEFSRIELLFTNKTKISLTKSDLKYYIERPQKYKRSHFYDTLAESLKEEHIAKLKETFENSDSLQNQRIKTVQILREIGIKINAPSQFIYDTIRKFIVEYEAIDFHKVIEKIDNQISSKVLYFPTFRRIEEELKNLGKFPKPEILERYIPYLDEEEISELNKQSEEDDIIQFGMSDVENRIKEITKQITRSSMIGYSQISGELLSQLLKGFPDMKFNKRTNEEIDKIRIILERIGDNMPAEDRQSILDYVKSGKSTNNELLFFLDKLINLYKKQEKLDISIKNFIEVCNGYLVGKKYYYNESEVTLNIIREKSQDIVTLNQLSSGEKQIVSLFSKIYLEPDNEFIVLFDEPELSLSIYWQQRLLPDILNSNRCNFLLAVTHSPFIFENELDKYAVGLSEYVKIKK